MFLWIYRNLLKVRSVQESRSGLLPLGSAQTPVPPSSASKADWWSVTLGVAEQSENEDQRIVQPSNESPTIASAADRKESLPSSEPLSRGEAARVNKWSVPRMADRDLQNASPCIYHRMRPVHGSSRAAEKISLGERFVGS